MDVWPPEEAVDMDVVDNNDDGGAPGEPPDDQPAELVPAGGPPLHHEGRDTLKVTYSVLTTFSVTKRVEVTVSAPPSPHPRAVEDEGAGPPGAGKMPPPGPPGKSQPPTALQTLPSGQQPYPQQMVPLPQRLCCPSVGVSQHVWP